MPQQTHRSRLGRAERRFRPGAEEGKLGLGTASQLETRTLLSHAAHGVRATVQVRPLAHAARVTPANEINAAYTAFGVDFKKNEQQYLDSINTNAGGTKTVTTTLTAPYTALSNTMTVADATGFGSEGNFSPPVPAQATIGGTSLGAFSLTGRNGATTLFVSPSNVSLPQSTTLTATVTTTSQSSAASIFSSYIVNRTNQMAIELVQYFNSLPLRLPFLNAPPHTPNNRGAVQKYVYDSIVGGSSSATSLQASLLSIPLPTTAGNDLQIYNATVSAAIEQSRIQTLNGVSEVYAKALYISAPQPNNRFGVVAPKTVPAYYTSF